MSNLLNIFKKNRNNKVVDENLENIKMIPVPDIRAYMIKGYEEINEVKNKNVDLESSLKEFKEKAEKFEKLYDAALVTSREFENRYNNSQKESEHYKNLFYKEQEFRNIDNKASKQEYDKLKERTYILEERLKNKNSEMQEEIKSEIITLIKNTKGTLSKDKIVKLISEVSNAK